MFWGVLGVWITAVQNTKIKEKKTESDLRGVDCIANICLQRDRIERKRRLCRGENCELVLQEWTRRRPQREEHQSRRPRRLATTAGAPPEPETTATDQVGGVCPACGHTCTFKCFYFFFIT